MISEKKRRILLTALVVVSVVAVVFLFAGKKYDQRNSSEVSVSETANEEATDGASQPPRENPRTSTSIAPLVQKLHGSTFRLSSYNGHVIPQGGNYTISFEAGSGVFEDGFIRAKFCNTLNGPYTLERNVFRSKLSGSKMYCATPQDVMDIEGAFNVLVDGGAQMTLQGNALTFTDNVKTMVFLR